MTATQAKVRAIYAVAIRAAIALVILAIARVVLRGLPMLQELWVRAISMSGVDIVGMVISLAMASVVFNLGKGLSKAIGEAWPRLYKVGAAIAAAASLGALVIAYDALLPLAKTLFSQDIWIYRVVFLGAVCIPLYQLGRTAYLGIGDVVAFFADRSEALLASKALPCPRCGKTSASGARFCAACGSALTEEVPAPAIAKACPRCGAELPAEAKFCPHCGSAIPTEGDAKALCPQCGAETQSGARFCSACGANLPEKPQGAAEG